MQRGEKGGEIQKGREIQTDRHRHTERCTEIQRETGETETYKEILGLRDWLSNLHNLGITLMGREIRIQSRFLRHKSS